MCGSDRSTCVNVRLLCTFYLHSHTRWQHVCSFRVVSCNSIQSILFVLSTYIPVQLVESVFFASVLFILPAEQQLQYFIPHIYTRHEQYFFHFLAFGAHRISYFSLPSKQYMVTLISIKRGEKKVISNSRIVHAVRCVLITNIYHQNCTFSFIVRFFIFPLSKNRFL